jgi:predicted ATPase
LRRHRVLRGFSQEVLAERAGLSLRGLSDLERGLRRPHATTIGRLVEALRLDDPEREALVASVLQSTAREPVRERSERSARLPVPLTSFVGRDAEIATLRDMVSEGSSRLLTLVGPGGTGKTRLAIELARVGPHPAVFADLAPLDSPELVPGTVAVAFGLADTGPDDLTTRLDRELGERSLLVLDNCEHLPDACARLAEDLLRACPRLGILATSREPLNAQGEVVWPLAPLDLPSSGSEPDLTELEQVPSVRLFVERARAADPGFALTPIIGRWLVEICTRVDGLPLAIELAAARVRALGVRELAHRLDDRFGVLVGGQRTAPPRHQTLRATLDWSYELLTEPERQLFARLAVFAGGFTATAAEALCGDDSDDRRHVLRLLGRLVDRSLLVVDTRPDARVRYRMLETVREYAYGHLQASDELEALRRRHAEFYRRLAAEAERAIWGVDGPGWLTALSCEVGNLRAVVEWGLASADHLEVALATVADLVIFWKRTGRVQEGSLHLQHLLAAGGRQTSSGAWALFSRASLAFFSDDFDLAQSLVREALELAEARHDQRSWIYAAMGVVAVDVAADRHEHARALLERALSLARQSGDGVALSNLLLHHAELVLRDGNPVDAEALLVEAVEVAQRQSDDWSVAFAWFHLGRLARVRGDVALARSWQLQTLTLWRSLVDELAVSHALDELAMLAVTDEDFVEAVRLFAIAETIRTPTGGGPFPTWHADREQALAATRAYFGEAAFAAAWQAAQQPGQADAVIDGLSDAASK